MRAVIVLAVVFGLSACGKKVDDAEYEAISRSVEDKRYGFVEHKLPDGTRCVVYATRAISCDWSKP